MEYLLITQLSTSIWLVPEYTKDPSDACTSFTVATHSSGQSSTLNLDRTHGTHRYLVAVKNTEVLQKITEVALIRRTQYDGTLNITSLGYDGMSTDIRNMSTNNPLYLMWKTAKSRRV